MLLDLILLIIIVFLGFWVLKLKAQNNQIYKPSSSHAKKVNEEKEEFTLGMKGLNSDFSDNVLQDSLTGLPRREAFEDRLIQTVNQSSRFEKSFGVMYFDIDDFHLINEKYGEEIGDKIIIEMSKRLQQVIRQIDTVTRFAGDKFIILLPQLSLPETAAYVAQRLLDSAVLPFVIDGKQISLTGSVGVAIYPNDGHDAQILLRNANDALQQAKALGNGLYKFYRQELHALGQRELSINAVFSKEDYLQHLIIYYQPQIDTTTNEVIAIQASPVLKIAEFGHISFEDFARIAENRKRAIYIWEWLLRNAVMQFKKWRDNGFKPKNLIIDVTYNQIQNPEFILKITQILQEFKLDPKELIFEIAEKNLTKNTESIEKSFDMLNNINIQLGLSVFALGNLALHKITQLPVSYLKIDAQLIKEKKDFEEYEGILRTLVSLAEETHIDIVAESVENNSQKELLESLGCTVMRGKLFSEAFPIQQ